MICEICGIRPEEVFNCAFRGCRECYEDFLDEYLEAEHG